MRLIAFSSIRALKYLSLTYYFSSTLKNKLNFFLYQTHSLNIYTKNYNVPFTLNFFKLNSLYKTTSLIDLTVIDFPQNLLRFKIVYQLLSIFSEIRLNLISFLKELSFHSSVKKIFTSAN